LFLLEPLKMLSFVYAYRSSLGVWERLKISMFVCPCPNVWERLKISNFVCPCLSVWERLKMFKCCFNIKEHLRMTDFVNL
jgi:hypothetical protein